MSDIIDSANDHEEYMRNIHINRIRAYSEVKRPCKKKCYNCEEPLEAPHLFCDSDCASDFEKLNNRR